MVCESRESFYNSLDDNFLTNPKRFRSIFKLNNKRSSVPDIMSMGNAAEPKPSQPCTVSTPIYGYCQSVQPLLHISFQQ